MSEEIRMGLVGAGGLGRALAEAAAAVEGVSLTAVADVSEEALAEAGEAFGVPPAERYGDHETLLSEAPVDGVFVVTPHSLHRDQILDALDAGLHVFTEKPMVTATEDAHEVTAAAERSDRTVMVGFQRHVMPCYRHLRERWAEHPTRLVTGELGQDWFENIAVGWRGDPEMNGGGFLYDSGAHLLDAVLWAHGGTPTEVSADVSLSDPDDHRTDAESTLNVRFDDGSRAVLSFSGRAPGWHERAAGWDEAGRVVVEEQEVTVHDWGGEPHTPDVAAHDWDQQSEGKIAAFAEAVRTGEEPPATARDGLRAVAVTEAAYESGRTGEPVEVDL